MTDEAQGEIPEIEDVNEEQGIDAESEEVEAEQTGDDAAQGEGEEAQEEVTPEKYEELKKAVDRKTAALSDVNRKMREYQEQIQELQRMTQANQEALEPEPDFDDFDTHAEYREALGSYLEKKASHDAQQKFIEQQQALQMQKMSQERATMAQKHEREYLEVNPAYKQSKTEFNNFIAQTNVDRAVEIAIVEQAFEGNSAQIIDYFGADHGKNLDQLAEIVKMTPSRAAVEIYKIQQTLDKPKKKAAEPAPKPVKTKPSNAKANKDLSKGDVLKNLGLK